jgi:hypothetical protein
VAKDSDNTNPLKGNEMNVVIRHPVSKLYRGENGAWVSDWKEAQHFPDTAQAERVCCAERIDAYQLMKKDADERYGRVVLERLPDQVNHNGDHRTHFFQVCANNK